MSSAAPIPSRASGAVDADYTISYVGGSLTVTPALADDHRRQPDQGLRCGSADAHRSVHGIRQRRHLGQPDHSAHADVDGHRRQPRRGKPLRHHRQRCGRSRLHDQLRRGQLDRHAGRADDHRRQPDQGLRRGAADPDGQLHRLRQWRHLGQPDHPAHAQHDRHAPAAITGSPYAITASGAVDTDYTITYVAGTLTVTAGAADDHGRQPDQGLRRRAADADGQLLGLRQRRHVGQPDHSAHA